MNPSVSLIFMAAVSFWVAGLIQLSMQAARGMALPEPWRTGARLRGLYICLLTPAAALSLLSGLAAGGAAMGCLAVLGVLHLLLARQILGLTGDYAPAPVAAMRANAWIAGAAGLGLMALLP